MSGAPAYMPVAPAATDGSAPENELGAASVGNPNPAVVVSPRPVANAITPAELAREPHTPLRVRPAEMAIVTIGFTDEHFVMPLFTTVFAAFFARNQEIGAATVGDPNSIAAFPTPRPSFNARRPAQLAGESSASKTFERANVPSAVV